MCDATLPAAVEEEVGLTVGDEHTNHTPLNHLVEIAVTGLEQAGELRGVFSGSTSFTWLVFRALLGLRLLGYRRDLFAARR